MRLGILIIGSLYWDPSRPRCGWRQRRLGRTDVRRVKVPIRYGKKSKKRNDTYTMVFAMSCSEPEKLGTALVVPARAECCAPEHLLEEAEHLWAAERDVEAIGGICAGWGKVCVLTHPELDPGHPIPQAWYTHVQSLGGVYGALPAADAEAPILEPARGVALFEWPIDIATNTALVGFDLLLMTVTKPTFHSGRYPTAEQVAEAWKADTKSNVLYFHNNRHYRITTFEDARIQALLAGEPPNPALQPSAVMTRRCG